MSQLVNNVEIKLFTEQYNAFNFATQFGAAIAGKQSGKTYCGALWSGKKMNEFPLDNGMIVAPTYKILNQSTLDKFFSLFPLMRKYYKEQKGEIDLPFGGKIFIRSADNPNSLEGITAKWIWADEAGQFSLLAWNNLRGRVAFTGGQIFITTTPYNMGWLYTEFYKPWKNRTDLNLSVFNWKSIDNPYFPIQYFEDEKKRLSPEEFHRAYCGLFEKMEGLVYNLPDEQVIDPIDNINVKDIICGVDWGFHNEAALVVIKISSDNVFYVVDEYYKSGKTTDELIEELKRLQNMWHFTKIYPDPAEPDRIATLKQRGFMVATVDKNVELGINKTRELILKRQLYVFNNCKNILDEFETYHYAPDKIKEEPVKENDHGMDAIRYAVYNYLPWKPQSTSFGTYKPLYPEFGVN